MRMQLIPGLLSPPPRRPGDEASAQGTENRGVVVEHPWVFTRDTAVHVSLNILHSAIYCPALYSLTGHYVSMGATGTVSEPLILCKTGLLHPENDSCFCIFTSGHKLRIIKNFHIYRACNYNTSILYVVPLFPQTVLQHSNH